MQTGTTTYMAQIKHGTFQTEKRHREHEYRQQINKSNGCFASQSRNVVLNYVPFEENTCRKKMNHSLHRTDAGGQQQQQQQQQQQKLRHQGLPQCPAFWLENDDALSCCCSTGGSQETEQKKCK